MDEAARGVSAISTLAPREGSDIGDQWLTQPSAAFQPSLPARGATLIYVGCVGTLRFQPSLPARGATIGKGKITHTNGISTLAPREGSDPAGSSQGGAPTDFNPRSPRGERR